MPRRRRDERVELRPAPAPTARGGSDPERSRSCGAAGDVRSRLDHHVRPGRRATSSRRRASGPGPGSPAARAASPSCAPPQAGPPPRSPGGAGRRARRAHDVPSSSCSSMTVPPSICATSGAPIRLDVADVRVVRRRVVGHARARRAPPTHAPRPCHARAPFPAPGRWPQRSGPAGGSGERRLAGLVVRRLRRRRLVVPGRRGLGRGDRPRVLAVVGRARRRRRAGAGAAVACSARMPSTRTSNPSVSRTARATTSAWAPLRNVVASAGLSNAMRSVVASSSATWALRGSISAHVTRRRPLTVSRTSGQRRRDDLGLRVRPVARTGTAATRLGCGGRGVAAGSGAAAGVGRGVRVGVRGRPVPGSTTSGDGLSGGADGRVGSALGADVRARGDASSTIDVRLGGRRRRVRTRPRAAVRPTTCGAGRGRAAAGRRAAARAARRPGRRARAGGGGGRRRGRRGEAAGDADRHPDAVGGQPALQPVEPRADAGARVLDRGQQQPRHEQLEVQPGRRRAGHLGERGVGRGPRTATARRHPGGGPAGACGPAGRWGRRAGRRRRRRRTPR